MVNAVNCRVRHRYVIKVLHQLYEPANKSYRQVTSITEAIVSEYYDLKLSKQPLKKVSK